MTGDVSICRAVTNAPKESPSASSKPRMSSPAIFLMFTTCSTRRSSSLISTRRSVPPAMMLAPVPISARSAEASFNVRGSWYSKRRIFLLPRPLDGCVRAGPVFIVGGRQVAVAAQFDLEFPQMLGIQTRRFLPVACRKRGDDRAVGVVAAKPRLAVLGAPGQERLSIDQVAHEAGEHRVS